ncbi:MAG: SpoIIE family protein phosphatase [Acidimicrobiales bacterium]
MIREPSGSEPSTTTSRAASERADPDAKLVLVPSVPHDAAAAGSPTGHDLMAQIESAPQAILAVSAERKVLACNRRFEELWCLEPGSVTVGGESPALLTSSLSQVRDPEAFEAAIRWGHAHRHELQQLDVALLDGRVIEGVSAPLLDAAGTYYGRIWFLADTTEQRRAETERASLLERLQTVQRSQNFLLLAAGVLARASGYAETLRELAAIAVPTLGDICLIDVIGESGNLERVAARHVDPSRQSLVDELGRLYPPDPKGLHPTVAAIRTRGSRWSGDMSDEFLRATTRDEHHFQLTKRLGFSSYMTVPLIDGTDVLGTITFVSVSSCRRLGPDDLALAEDLALQVASVAAKARRHEQQQHAAHILQASLLPAALPSIANLTIAVRYRPGTSTAEVGGDWYDIVQLSSGSALLAVGDVAGHDMGAAAAMGALRWAARALISHSQTPAGLLRVLHDSWEWLGVDRIATCVVAKLDPTTGDLTVASAGHPPPLEIADQLATYLPVDPGGPLGGPVRAVEDFCVRLRPRTVVLFYTDGVIETRETDVATGMEMLRSVALAGDADPEALCDRVLEALSVGADDIALLAVRLDEG